MQIINNEALHLNSTLKFMKTFTCTMHSQRSAIVLEGRKIIIGVGVGNLTYYKGARPSKRTQYINRYMVYLCISVILKFHGEGKWLR